jgi:hypothetical protein
VRFPARSLTSGADAYAIHAQSVGGGAAWAASQAAADGEPIAVGVGGGWHRRGRCIDVRSAAETSTLGDGAHGIWRPVDRRRRGSAATPASPRRAGCGGGETGRPAAERRTESAVI